MLKRSLKNKWQMANAINDPKTGKLDVSNHKIKEISLNYCKDTLANNLPEIEFEKEIELKKVDIENMMKKKERKLYCDKRDI